MIPTNKLLKNYILAAILGVLVGYQIIPVAITATFFAMLLIKILYHFFNEQNIKFFSLLPYAIYTEIFIRAYARYLPYLSVQYTMMIGFGFLILSNRKKGGNFHFKGIVFLACFFLLELLNNINPLSLRMTSSMQWQTFTLFIVCFWASFNKLDSITINKIFDNIRIATIFLAGIVLVAHLQSKIDYSSASSSEASNGMAPVQLSGYLGTGALLFLISILNRFDVRSKIIQIIFFVFAVTLMVLTFSRGGTYFVAIVILIYLFFNRKNLGSYFRILLLIPLGLGVYNFSMEKTAGKLSQRYEEKGASNREELVKIGFLIFFKYPVIGIGTGNYNSYIKKNGLFKVESGVHNEYVRAAAEHGIFGIITYWGFFIALLFTILKRKPPSKEYATYLFVLFFLITIHNGLKISLQPFILLMAVAILPEAVSQTSFNNIKNASIKLQPAI